MPGVTVPDTFTWTVQIGSASPESACLPIYGSPTVGTYVSNWLGGPGNWRRVGIIGSAYLARITVATTASVPEPSTFAVASVATLAGLAVTRSRRHRAR